MRGTKSDSCEGKGGLVLIKIYNIYIYMSAHNTPQAHSSKHRPWWLKRSVVAAAAAALSWQTANRVKHWTEDNAI